MMKSIINRNNNGFQTSSQNKKGRKSSPKEIKIGIVDDHNLMRMAMSAMLDTFDNCKTSLQVSSCLELVSELNKGNIPDIILVDLNLPEMDGYETAKWLKLNIPKIPIIIISNNDSEFIVMHFLRLGVKAFLKINIYPPELQCAILAVLEKGYYYPNNITSKLVRIIESNIKELHCPQRHFLNEKEIKFLRLASTESTYKEIAKDMNLSPKTIDKLRDNLFERFATKNRVGLVINDSIFFGIFIIDGY